MIIKSFRILINFFILDLKKTYFHGYFVLFEMLAAFLTVLIYYYSSKAFTPSSESLLNFYGTNFFSFLFWGDILLRVPQNIFYAPISNIKQSINDNTFESMVLLSKSVKTILLALSSMQLLREFISISFMIICAHYFFDLELNILSISKVVLILFAYFPLFLSLGFLVSGFILYFERGENSLNLVSNIMAILAGMYFPTEVFPHFISTLAKFLSPYSYFLRLSREVLQTGQLDWQNLCFTFACGILISWVCIHFIVYVLNKKKSMGQNLIIG